MLMSDWFQELDEFRHLRGHTKGTLDYKFHKAGPKYASIFNFCEKETSSWKCSIVFRFLLLSWHFDLVILKGLPLNAIAPPCQKRSRVYCNYHGGILTHEIALFCAQ